MSHLITWVLRIAFLFNNMGTQNRVSFNNMGINNRVSFNSMGIQNRALDTPNRVSFNNMGIQNRALGTQTRVSFNNMGTQNHVSCNNHVRTLFIIYISFDNYFIPTMSNQVPRTVSHIIPTLERFS